MCDEEKDSEAAKDAAEALVIMNSPQSTVVGKESPGIGQQGLEFVAVTKDKQTPVQRKRAKWAQKERREELNRERYEAEKQRQQKVLARQQNNAKINRQRQEAMRRLRRQKYKEQIRKRESDESKKAELERERTQRAEQAAARRRLERRKDMPRRLLAVLHRQSAGHELKIKSLMRGEPLFSLENPATEELIVQFCVEHLHRLQPKKWLNQEIIDWYICIIISESASPCLFLGAEFHRQLQTHGPKFVVDFHRPVTLRGVCEGKQFCALEGTGLILAPANPNRNHWVLIAIFPELRKVCCYDSLSPGPTGSSECRSIVDGLMEWVALHEKRRSGTMKGWISEMVQGLPRQQNTWDCGVHVCDFARMLALGPSEVPLCVDSETANAFRARLLVYALESALVSY